MPPYPNDNLFFSQAVALVAIVFLVSAALFGSSLWMLRSRTVPNPSIGQGGAQLQRTPDGLRRCASVLAGSLFSLLVEAGEKLESPPPDYSKLSDLDVPDPRITRLISDQGIDKRINEVFVHAQDLCLLHGMSADVPQNVSEVRSKIADLRYLVQEIGR